MIHPSFYVVCTCKKMKENESRKNANISTEKLKMPATNAVIQSQENNDEKIACWHDVTIDDFDTIGLNPHCLPLDVAPE